MSTESMKARLAAKRAAAGIDGPATTPLSEIPAAAVFAGVNPPEKDLPPPPVAVIETPVLPPVENTATPIGAEKPKRGRPKKSPPIEVVADITVPAQIRGTTAEQDAAPIGSPGKEMPEQMKYITAAEAAVCGAQMVAQATGDVGMTFTVTWGEERYLAPGEGFRESYVVGPFTATGTVLAGEDLPAAMRRVEAKLNAFAIGHLGEKAASFKRRVAA